MYEGYEETYQDETGSNEVELVLPEPHEGQKRVIESGARFKVLLCGRRWGKTLVSQIIAIYDMLAGKSVAYVTPEFGLGKEFFSELNRLLPQQIIKTNNKSELFIELKTGGSLRFLSGEALDSFRGRKFHKVIIDEAAKISELKRAWNTAIRPTLADYKGDAIFISTPRGRDFFYTLYTKGLLKENGYESFQYATSANPYIDKDEIEAARQELSEAEFNQEYLAIPGENEGSPFKQKDIQENTLKDLSESPTVCYAIDVAKAKDWSVCIGMSEDGQMTYFDRWRTTHEDTKERIRNLPSGTMKVIDSTGIGSVILEDLEHEVYNLHGFVFTSQSKPMIMRKLITDFEQGFVKVNEITAIELSTMEYKVNPSGHVAYLAASGSNDDCVMALAMANFYRGQHYNIQNWKLYVA